MEILELKRKLRRFDLLDYFLIKLACVVVGIIIATYLSGLRGFVEQNVWVVVFIFVVMVIRPVVRYLR